MPLRLNQRGDAALIFSIVASVALGMGATYMSMNASGQAKATTGFLDVEESYYAGEIGAWNSYYKKLSGGTITNGAQVLTASSNDMVAAAGLPAAEPSLSQCSAAVTPGTPVSLDRTRCGDLDRSSLRRSSTNLTAFTDTINTAAKAAAFPGIANGSQIICGEYYPTDSNHKRGLCTATSSDPCVPAGSGGGLIDFETIPGSPPTTPTAGQALSTQYLGSHGVEFWRNERTSGTNAQLLENNGPCAFIKKGSPQTSFNGTADDTCAASAKCGTFTLSDDNTTSTYYAIVLHYSNPVGKASGYAVDLSGADEILTVKIYNSAMSLLTPTARTALDSNDQSGYNSSTSGGPTYWALERSQNDISYLRISRGNDGQGFDNFSPSGQCPTLP